MQVLCKSTNGNAEAHCCVCGQGFIMFWERQTRMDRAEARREIQKVLLGHHENGASPQAHPKGGFLVPQWDGPIAFSGAAVPGSVPSWSL
ncbi:MAG: hypothetical protein ABSE87_07100 [Terracidiphilus sp.]